MGHIASECKENEFEDTRVAKFGFMEEISDFFLLWIYWEKAKLSRDSGTLWEFWTSEALCSEREREYFLYIWLQERCVNICWKSWNKRRRSVWERGVTRKYYDSRDCWEILNTPTPNALMVQRFDLLKGLHMIAQLGKTRVYILEEKLEMDASQTVNGLKCCS